MNPSDLLVRIERIAGNFNPRHRPAIESLAGDFLAQSVQAHKNAIPMLSPEECDAVRAMLRSVIGDKPSA